MSPGSATAGPLHVAFAAPAGPLYELIAATLALYDVAWSDSPMRAVDLRCEVADAPSEDARGDYLECAQMLVDATPDGLLATTTHGGLMSGSFTESGERWLIHVSPEIAQGGAWPDVEDLLSLVLTTGWRRAGWVPLHAAGLTDGQRGVLVCAGSGGGKTTFTVAMARRGWRALGDDKLLLAADAGQRQVVAIKQMLNLDPAVHEWFPEVGDLTVLPQYSTLSPKRRVPLRALWPSAPAPEMAPTHLLALDRSADMHGISVTAMSPAETISTLLHQSVIPRDARVATPIVRTLATLAQRVVGLRVTVGDGAYADAHALRVVEEALA